jgi:hypothetical protein
MNYYLMIFIGIGIIEIINLIGRWGRRGRRRGRF